MVKIRNLLNKLLYLLIDTADKLFTYLKKLKEENKLKYSMPIRDVDYFDTLINFLLDNSNNHSGINFYSRLENIYLDSIDSFNANRKLNGQEPYVPHPDFALELQYVNITWIRNITNNNFLKLI